MKKTILITGATDGIGLETAKQLAAGGHNLLIHGRNPTKLEEAKQAINSIAGEGNVETYVADFSRMSEVAMLALNVSKNHSHIDVIINNAGVYGAPSAKTDDGLDIRFAVNTFAPYLLTRRLLRILQPSSRVINVSSAAQSPVDANALLGQSQLPDGLAYAQSKLAITMWSADLAYSLGSDGPSIIAVNPGSMLGSKMVKNAFGVSGGDLGIGADILVRASLSDEFEDASGKYFDNDSRQFAPPHPYASDHAKNEELTHLLDTYLAKILTDHPE